MKYTLLISVIVIIAMGACSKSNTTRPTTPSSTTKPAQWPWTWDNVKLTGKDTSDVIIATGYDRTNNHYGTFVYKKDTYTIAVTGLSQVQVVQSASTGYDLTGTYDTVHLHSTDGKGSDWTAFYGYYHWQGGKGFYQLKLVTSTTFFNKTYTDTL